MRREAYGLLVFALLAVAGCAAQAKEDGVVSRMLEGPLDTVSVVTLYDWDGGEEPIQEVFEMLHDIDARMSAASEESEITSVSGHEGVPATVSADTFRLIEYAKSVSMDTDGAFDATISPIVRLWGIGTEDARVPTREEIASALLSVGYQDIALDRGASAVTLGKKGMRLDLGGIAKGHACDEAVGILKNAGVSHAIIDLGGNIYAYGTRPDGSPWRVGVKSPLLGENEYFAIVTASEQAVVTSGVYERFLESGGALYHHIMDPRTGYPVDNGLLSVTIVSGSSTQADALSTACFVLGAERGIEYLSGLPGVEGIFVSDDLSVKVTDGLKGSFTVKDGRFRLVGSDEEG